MRPHRIFCCVRLSLVFPLHSPTDTFFSCFLALQSIRQEGQLSRLSLASLSSCRAGNFAQLRDVKLSTVHSSSRRPQSRADEYENRAVAHESFWRVHLLCLFGAYLLNLSVSK